MMLEDPYSRGHSRSNDPRVLMISGVTISKPYSVQDQERPRPDYVGLVEAFQPDIIDFENIHAVKYPLVSLISRKYDPCWAIAFATLLKSHRYKAVIATGTDVGLLTAFLFKIFRVRTPLIMFAWNVETRRPAFLLGKLHVGSIIRKFLCLTHSQARVLTEHYHIPAEKIYVTYYSVDHHYFRPMPEVTPRHQVCSAGMAERDYATLIEATRGMDIEVKIDANSAWWQSALNIPMDQLPDHVEVYLNRTTQALRQLYAESLFVVVPVLDVAYPAGYTTILEAMAMGKAVIVSKLQHPYDGIEDGWNGLYVPPGKVEELRARIQFLLENPEEARRLGANARKTIEERFTQEHYVQRVLTAVQDVIGEDVVVLNHRIRLS